jgi:hypothetical protein
MFGLFEKKLSRNEQKSEKAQKKLNTMEELPLLPARFEQVQCIGKVR